MHHDDVIPTGNFGASMSNRSSASFPRTFNMEAPFAIVPTGERKTRPRITPHAGRAIPSYVYVSSGIPFR